MNGRANFVANAVTGTDANDSFNFGCHNDAELTSFAFGNGSILDVEKLTVATLDIISMR